MSCAHCGKGPVTVRIEHAHGAVRDYCGAVCCRSDCPAAPEPFVVNIPKASSENEAYAATLFSGTLEFKLIHLKDGEDIPTEVHTTADQFFRVEEGKVRIVVGCGKETIELFEGEACVIPKGTHHRVVNADNGAPAKLTTLYAPAQHPVGTVYKTRADAL